MNKKEFPEVAVKLECSAGSFWLIPDKYKHIFKSNDPVFIASESYDTFARELQNEMLEALSDKPTKLTPDVLKNRVVKNSNNEEFVFDEIKAMNLIPIDKFPFNKLYKIPFIQEFCLLRVIYILMK